MKTKRTPAATAPVAHASRTVQRRRNSAIAADERDDLAVEEPLEIRVEGRPVAVTMRTPGHDEELAAGFLLTEGVIVRYDEVRAIAPVMAKGRIEPNVIDVRLVRPEAVDFARLTRHVFTTSSCGLCGKATIAAVQARSAPLTPEYGPQVSAKILAQMPVTLAAAQPVFQRTGGLHAAGLFAADGRLLVLREDVGRHNAVDKVLGHLLLSGKITPADAVLLVSGRVAFEIVQKALAARIAVIAAISAPTTLAVDFARTNGQTLVGFLRGSQMNVYAGSDRIVA
jgi:FdhD protein